MYGSSILGVVVLRIQQPNLHRPFKIFIGIPILVFLVAVFLVVIPTFLHWEESLIIFGIILSGIPVYFVFIYFAPSHPMWMKRGNDRAMMFMQDKLNMVVCKSHDE